MRYRSSPEADLQTLRRLQRLAGFMDSALRIPGTRWRVGADALIGLLPGIGDSATALVSLYLVAEAWRLGATTGTKARMLGNVAVDLIVGSIPLVGDIFDVGFRANRRNVDLLQRDLEQRRLGPGGVTGAGAGRSP